MGKLNFRRLLLLGDSITLLFLLLACDATPDRLSFICGGLCYTGPASSLGRGLCAPGRWHCGPSGRPDTCEGQVLPALQLCDGVDRACTGHPNEDLHDGRVGVLCGPARVGICHPGATTCQGGQIVCEGAAYPQEESCASPGTDWNCNGVPNDITPEVCYTGDPLELTYPSASCRAGVTSCSNGQQDCQGEVLPMPEHCGAGRDDNCDGLIDDVTPTIPMDIVILINLEGGVESMYLPTWKAGLIDLAKAKASPLYRYAIVAVGDWYTMPSALVETPFTDYQGFLNGVAALSLNSDGWEAVNRGIVSICDGTAGLTFRPGVAHLIVGFFDDNDESLEEGPTSSNVEDTTVFQTLEDTDTNVLAFAPSANNLWQIWAGASPHIHLVDVGVNSTTIAQDIASFFPKGVCP